MLTRLQVPRASLITRWLARRQDEVATTQLEAFRRAGTGVFQVCLLADERRAALAAEGRHPWDGDAASTSLFLAAWNARVHQALAVELLDNDAREDPRTAGFVPVETYRQVWTLFQPVQEWMSAAQRAAATPDFWIGDEVDLPSALPALHRPRGAPAKHLKGLLVAGDALDRLVEQELGAVVSAGAPPARYEPVLHRIHELAAQARASLHYAQGLWHPGVTGELQDVIVGHLHPALVLEHHLGQFLALPELATRYRTGPLQPSGRRRRPFARPV